LAKRAPSIAVVDKRLSAAFGELQPPRVWDPLDELILTILSQNTSDANSGRAFDALRFRFATWDEVADAPTQEVADSIRSGGLANVKAPRIQAVLREIDRREGGFDLEWMRGASDDDVSTYLSSLPGVGPKTVACVLAFSLGRPAMPVDTHVHRVAGRLGLIPPNASAERAHDLLAGIVPADRRLHLHMALIKLGRETCRAQKPRCSGCPLSSVCPSSNAPVVG
jgi:endonuclease-3